MVTGIRVEAFRVVTSPALGAGQAHGKHPGGKEELLPDRPGKGQEELWSRVFQLRQRNRNPVGRCGQQEHHRRWLRIIRKDLEEKNSFRLILCPEIGNFS